jgi:hypothetical protein
MADHIGAVYSDSFSKQNATRLGEEFTKTQYLCHRRLVALSKVGRGQLTIRGTSTDIRRRSGDRGEEFWKAGSFDANE